jgi:hypothetical protein
MPEVLLCQDCRGRLDPDKDEYVVPNRATAKTKAQWVYAHATCAEGSGGFAASMKEKSDAEMEALHKRMMEEHIRGLSDEALRALGLQRTTDQGGGT